MSESSRLSCFAHLFPSQWSALIFVSYMVLFINQGILVTATKTDDNKYNYSTVAVVLLTECVKLLMAIAIYSKDKPMRSLMPDILSGYKVLILYFVPAFLYCLYNNLAFINLGSYDPTTYYLLLQFRVAITGVVYQILFKRKLSAIQWLSLILLTIGCIIKQLGGLSLQSSSFVNFNLLLILVQVFCSCFAGVYNEYLLKDVGSKVHIMIQNVFMYIDSIVCNVLVLAFTAQLSSLSRMSDFVTLFSNPKIVAVIINNALCGIVTSIFLKNLNSILKSFASALELVFTAVLCFFIFGFAIDFYTIIAIVVVSFSIYVYSQNPIPLNKSLQSNNGEHNDIMYSQIKEKNSTEQV